MLVTALGATPALAQMRMTLSPGFSPSDATTRGFTRSSFSLPTLANRDRNNNPCLGYGNNRDTPDYVLNLKSNFPKLQIQVQSQGNSPTLLIQRNRETVFCGSDTISSTFESGTYNIWVGCDEGTRCDYVLSIRE